MPSDELYEARHTCVSLQELMLLSSSDSKQPFMRERKQAEHSYFAFNLRLPTTGMTALSYETRMTSLTSYLTETHVGIPDWVQGLSGQCKRSCCSCGSSVARCKPRFPSSEGSWWRRSRKQQPWTAGRREVGLELTHDMAWGVQLGSCS
jgi:hypothetical protein